jgi:hypothetical protein
VWVILFKRKLLSSQRKKDSFHTSSACRCVWCNRSAAWATAEDRDTEVSGEGGSHVHACLNKSQKKEKKKLTNVKTKSNAGGF